MVRVYRRVPDAELCFESIELDKELCAGTEIASPVFVRFFIFHGY